MTEQLERDPDELCEKCGHRRAFHGSLSVWGCQDKGCYCPWFTEATPS